MRITIVGAGRVGRTLGRLAHEAGYEIREVIASSSLSARSAVRFIGSGRPQSRAEVDFRQTDIVLISTPDDRISDSIETIRLNAASLGRPIVFHTSGVHSSRLLSPLAEIGFSTASCHPLQTFPEPSKATRLVSGSYFCIEGQRGAVRRARTFVRRLGGRPFEIQPELKPVYHAAAVLASGGVTSLLNISINALVKCGLDEASARRAILPLSEGTLATIRMLGTAKALTGPVRRGDVATVELNRDHLKRVSARASRIYELLAIESLDLASKTGTDERALKRMRKMLGARS